MKISQKGPADAELNRLVQNDKAVGGTRREGDAKVQKERESSRVDISPQARKLQRIAELARSGDELRAEKVKQLKEQVNSGQYQPDSKEVAQSIARSEVARLLGEK
jgi:negative regulator of flagellin synthesis FlgM